MDDLTDEQTKRYIHHYNFPPYSVGEARAPRSPGRREIGHGNLAERALIPVLPAQAEFPYTIRCVSEVLSSNGSTSQGSICGSTLALMDAGVPIKAPVAGISCGLIQDGDDFTTFIDIQGVEDFHGEMDFKVAGTKKGITAIQMDLKNDGLTMAIIKNALDITYDARVQILDQIMLPCIAEPRPEVSPYAPKMITMKIDPDRIREVIGKGGSVIQKIVADTGAKIDIDDDGTIHIASADAAASAAREAAATAAARAIGTRSQLTDALVIHVIERIERRLVSVVMVVPPVAGIIVVETVGLAHLGRNSLGKLTQDFLRNAKRRTHHQKFIPQDQIAGDGFL